MEKPGCSSCVSRCSLASPSGVATSRGGRGWRLEVGSHVSEQSRALRRIGKRPVRGSASAIGVTASKAPPRHAELIVVVVAGWWTSLQELAHVRTTQLHGVELAVTGRVRDVSPVRGAGGRAATTTGAFAGRSGETRHL